MSAPEIEAVDVCYAFGPFRLDPSRGTLTRDGEPVPLTPKLYDTLLLFVENAGRVLSRETLTETLWPDTIVSDTSLTQNIFLLRKAIGEDAIKTVPRKGYRFVLPVTLGPRRKISVALRLSGARAAVRPRRKWWSIAIAAAIGLAIAVAAGWLLHGWSSRRRSTFAREAAMSRKQPSVVTAPFVNERQLAGDGWLRTALPRMLADELAAGERLRVAPSETAIRMPLDLHIAETTTFAPETAARIGRYAQSDLILCGSFAALGEAAEDDIELTARVQDVRSGEVIAAASAVGSRARLFAVVHETAAGLRAQLGVAAPAPAEQRAAERLSAPANLAAARSYARGLEELHRYNLIAARDLLLDAAKADPQYALTHRALCEVWTKLAQDAKAKEEAALAVSLAHDLPRPQQLEIEALRAQTNRQFAEAVETRRALWRFYPDNADYALDLVSSLYAASNAPAGLEVIREIRARKIAGDDPRVDFAEANLHVLAGSWGDAIRLSEAAIARLRDGGSRALLCRALSLRATALQRKGDPAWRANVEQSLAIARAIGYSTYVIRALNTLAIGYSDDGEPDKAIPLLREAERISVRNGDVRGQLGSLGNLAYTCLDAGRWKEADEAAVRALELARASNDKVNESILVNRRGTSAAWQGRFAEARPFFEEALTRSRALSRNSGIAQNLGDLGTLAFIDGRLTDAKASFHESLAVYETISADKGAAEMRVALAMVALEQNKIAEARTLSSKDPVTLARVAIAEGDRTRAMKVLDELLARSPKRDDASPAHALRALALDSASEAALALQLLDVSLPYHDAMIVRVDAARATRSLPSLESVIRDTAARGDVAANLAARLARCEISGSGCTETARDARAHGFERIANKAQSR